jgi:hypothetical protein
MVIVTTIYKEDLNISKNNKYVAYVEKILVVVPKSWYFTKCIYNLWVTIFYSNVLLGPS